MPADSSDAHPPAAAVRVNCPQCGHPIDIIPITAAPPAASASASAPPAIQAGRAILAAVGRWITPDGDPAGLATGAAPPADSAPVSRRWMLPGVALIMAAVIALLIVWGRPEVAAPPVSSVPDPTSPSNSAATAEQEAAIRATLTGYNAAETEAAALLRIDPLTPYLAPEGPLAARRTAELAERQRRNAPHRSILVRWGIGAIAINGDTATAITQETWSNQEAGAVAPEQATVRVIYTLRWDAAAGRWLIVTSERTGV